MTRSSSSNNNNNNRSIFLRPFLRRFTIRTPRRRTTSFRPIVPTKRNLAKLWYRYPGGWPGSTSVVPRCRHAGYGYTAPGVSRTCRRFFAGRGLENGSWNDAWTAYIRGGRGEGPVGYILHPNHLCSKKEKKGKKKKKKKNSTSTNGGALDTRAIYLIYVHTLIAAPNKNDGHPQKRT